MAQPQKNNVDICMELMRQFQAYIFNPDASPNKLFQKTNEIMNYLEKASKEINTNYAEISRKLTEQLNTGRVQED